MELADILSQDAVLVCSSMANKHDVLKALAQRAAELTGNSADDIFEALDTRESLGSTGLGNGIAVPHGKFSPLRSVVAVFMKLDTPVEFDAVDDQKVDIVMMLLAPMGAGADHLKALARVARLLRSDSTADALRRTSDSKRIYGILTRPIETTQAA